VRREAGEPLEWIVGRVRFAGVDLDIRPGVFVPRPQTEELVRRAGASLPPQGRAADLCTGCGAVGAGLLALEPSVRVVCVDLDQVAARCARRNGLPAVAADLDTALRVGVFDLVTAVAPYVPSGELRLLPSDVQRYEPRGALDGGDDGLDVVRRVVRAAARLLRPGGSLVTEIGGDQDASLAPDLEGDGFTDVDTWRDDEGALRGLIATKRAS